MVYKFFWFLQTQVLRLLIPKIGLISYVSWPMFILGGRKIFIGNKVRIFPASRLEVHGKGAIIIEDDVSIGQNLHLISFDNDLYIRKGTTISGNVFVTNVDHEYSEIGVHILKQKYIRKYTEIGENCFIGYGASIQAGTILGKQCIVGSNSVVRGVFPDFSIIVGVPARVIKRYNSETQEWQKTDNKGNFL